MNFSAIFSAMVLLAFSGLGAAAAEIGGQYRVVGINPDGSKYAGTVDITLSSDTNCTMVWTTGAGRTLTGICMRGPDRFDAAFGTRHGAGLVIYRVMPDGTLNGIWKMAGQQGIGTETLTPASGGRSAPSEAPVTSNPPAQSNYDTGVPDYRNERVQ